MITTARLKHNKMVDKTIRKIIRNQLKAQMLSNRRLMLEKLQKGHVSISLSKIQPKKKQKRKR